MHATAILPPETIRDLLNSSVAKAAIAEQEVARTTERQALLGTLAAAELDAAVNASERATENSNLEAVARAAQLKADEARSAWIALCSRNGDLDSSADHAINRLRDKLRPLGGDAIDAARRRLQIEKRGALGALSWRQYSEPTSRGGKATSLIPDGGNAAAERLIAAIDNALEELDVLERDASIGPAAIDIRLVAIGKQIESTRLGMRAPTHEQFVLPAH